MERHWRTRLPGLGHCKVWVCPEESSRWLQRHQLASCVSVSSSLSCQQDLGTLMAQQSQMFVVGELADLQTSPRLRLPACKRDKASLCFGRD